MNGIVLVVMNFPYYARMAVNLVRSIRSFDKQTPIQLITNCIHFFPDENEKNLFTLITYTEDTNAFHVKTMLPELSAFDNTLYLDVDMVALNIKLFKDLFESLPDLSIACRGSTPIMDAPEMHTSWDGMTEQQKTSQWADLKKVVAEYEITEGKWLQLSSEFIFFRKTEKILSYFKKAREIYEGMKIHSLIFGGIVPDELALGIACIKEDCYPEDQFRPIYWAHAERRHIRHTDPFINENYYGYSMGGANANENQKQFYNNMMVFHLRRLGEKAIFFKAQNKSRYVKGREKV